MMSMDSGFATSGNEWVDALHAFSGLRFKGEDEKALAVIEELVEKAEALKAQDIYVEDDYTEYHSFYEMFELVLYNAVFEPKKIVQNTGSIPMAEIYASYGNVLIELGRYDEAQMALGTARVWNPTNCKILFEYAETFKLQGDMARFHELTMEAFKLAFKQEDIARCNRNLGHYFITQKKWEEALGCFMMSLAYDESSNAAQSEIAFIQEQTNGATKEPSFERFEAIAEENGFPVGFDKDVLAMAYAIAEQAKDAEEYAAALYYMNIVYDLTQDDDIKVQCNALANSVNF